MVKKLWLVGCDLSVCVSMHRVFPQSGLNKCVFKQNNYEDMEAGVWVRISPPTLGSPSWVGHHEGWTGRVEGRKAKNWCVGGGRSRWGK